MIKNKNCFIYSRGGKIGAMREVRDFSWTLFLALDACTVFGITGEGDVRMSKFCGFEGGNGFQQELLIVDFEFILKMIFFMCLYLNKILSWDLRLKLKLQQTDLE